MNLHQKTALVTGGAQRLGRAMALALAARGCSVVLHYGRSEEAAAETVKAIEALGVSAWLLQADLSRGEEIERLVAETRAAAGRLDLLVNSAATFLRRPFEEISLAELDAVLAVNFKAPFLLSQRVAPLMRRSERAEPGLIVNLVDHASDQAWPGYSHHGAAKAALTQLTRITARELAPHIRVNAILPGAVLPAPGVTTESEAWRTVGERLPLARTGAPTDVGQALVYLAENDFVTGSVLTVDGGESLVGTAHRGE